MMTEGMLCAALHVLVSVNRFRLTTTTLGPFQNPDVSVFYLFIEPVANHADAIQYKNVCFKFHTFSSPIKHAHYRANVEMDINHNELMHF